MDPAGIGDDIFGEAAGRRSHYAITRFDVLHGAADGFDLARAFQPEPGAHPADIAVLMA